MTNELLESLYKLKDLLNKNEDIIRLNEKESAMLSDKDFIALSNEKEKLCSETNKENYSEERLKEIDSITIEMRNLKVTQEYLDAYNKATRVYEIINEELFYPFTNKMSLRSLLEGND